MSHPVLKLPIERHVVLEDYRFKGQRFTRSIIIPPTGGHCAEIFAVNEKCMDDGVAWREMVNQAKRTT